MEVDRRLRKRGGREDDVVPSPNDEDLVIVLELEDYEVAFSARGTKVSRSNYTTGGSMDERELDMRIDGVGQPRFPPPVTISPKRLRTS